MIQQILTTSFKKELLEAKHDFRTTGDTFKIALYLSSADLNSSTTAYTTTGEIPSGTGYTTGGATLTNVDPSSSGTVGFTQFQTVTWNANITARGALIYNSTEAGNPSVMVLDFGMDRSSVSGVFTITFNTFNSQLALIRLT